MDHSAQVNIHPEFIQHLSEEFECWLYEVQCAGKFWRVFFFFYLYLQITWPKSQLFETECTLGINGWHNVPD